MARFREISQLVSYPEYRTLGRIPRGCCKSRRFGGTYRLHHQGAKNHELGTTLSVTRNRTTTNKKETNSVTFSPQANYTDREVTACRRS
jgi:hypothetical protein